MGEGRVEIYDIMACNVYMDFENTGLRKEQHKFLVAFYPTGGAPIPELVESITAYGPNGYQVTIENQQFTSQNRNGWIYDRTTNGHWYMVNLDTGFMEEGKYTIEVKCRDGSVRHMSREQKNAPSEKLLAAYLKNREQIMTSHAPSKFHPFAPRASRRDISVSWRPLSELAGQDAFYIFRLSKGRSGKEFDTQNLVFWDNIFVQRMTQPEAGKNRGSVIVRTELAPETSYVYFVEVTDSNAMGQTNLCIFQPHQVFTT
jgi:hypothetical protein